jgi:hypothetical protein
MAVDQSMALLMNKGYYPPPWGYGPGAPKRQYVPAYWLQGGAGPPYNTGIKTTSPNGLFPLLDMEGNNLLDMEGIPLYGIRG